MSSANRPDKTGRDPTNEDPSSVDERRQPGPPLKESSQPGGGTDFGSFVSSSVRNSFQQLKRDAEINNPTPPAQRTSRRTRQGTDSTSRARRADTAERPATGPVGRRWRDAAPAGQVQPTAEESEPAESDGRFPDQEVERFDLGYWSRETFFDEDGPNRKLIAAIVAIVVIVILVVYLMARDGGNGGGDDPSLPTATISTVLTTDRTATPAEGIPATSTVESEPDTETPEVTPTTGVLEGGDNQLENGGP